jgi:uncharacterized protein
MRRTLAVALLVVTAACSSPSSTTSEPTTSPAPTSPAGSGASTAAITIDGTGGTIDLPSVELAATPEDRERGLMGRTELGADEGMLFVFPEPWPGAFWMKDTLIPLSIAFWGDDGRIHTISEMTPCEAEPCETYPAADLYTYALEMNAGWFAEHGVEVGDVVDVELPA